MDENVGKVATVATELGGVVEGSQRRLCVRHILGIGKYVDYFRETEGAPFVQNCILLLVDGKAGKGHVPSISFNSRFSSSRVRLLRRMTLSSMTSCAWYLEIEGPHSVVRLSLRELEDGVGGAKNLFEGKVCYSSSSNRCDLSRALPSPGT